MNINVNASVVPQPLEATAMFCLDLNYCTSEVLTQDMLTPPVSVWHV